MENAALRTGVFKAAALAGAAHLAFDLVASRVELTTPPYLLLDHASATFRELLLLDRETLLGTVAVVSAGVNGLIAGLFAAALAGARRPIVALTASLFALWVFSGGLMTLVYLDPPRAVVVGSLLAGAPRSLLVAWLLDRLVLPRPAAGEPAAR